MTSAPPQFVIKEKSESNAHDYMNVQPPSDEYRLEAFSRRDNLDLFDRIAELRVQAWYATGLDMGPDFPKVRLDDRIDETSLHFAVRHRETGLAAAVRLTMCATENDLPHPEWFRRLTEVLRFPLGYVSRLVVQSSHQGNGLGYYLDSVCIEAARSHQATSVLCDIPDYRLAGFKRRGFRVVQPPTRGIVFPTIHFIGMLLDLGNA